MGAAVDLLMSWPMRSWPLHQPTLSERRPQCAGFVTTFNMIMWNILKSVWNVLNIKKVSGLDARLRAQALIPQPVLEVVYSVAQRCLGDVLQAS